MLTVSDSYIDNCEAETRIDHQVDDDDKRASPNSICTIDGLDSSSSSDGGSSESSQSNDKSRKRSRSPSDDRRGNFKKPTSQRSDDNRGTSCRHGNNGERQQSRNDRSDDGQQRNRSSNQNRPDYSDNGYSNLNRNQSRDNSDYDNRQYNNNSMSNSNFNFQNGQGYNSRGNQNYEGFNPNSSYRFQNNDRDLEQSSSQRSIYTKYLELQIQQASTLQGPSIYSDEFSASQSCISNSNQLGYIQTTPSSVTTRPVVAPQGLSSFNELGNQQGPTSSREVLPLTPSLSSSLTLPVNAVPLVDLVDFRYVLINTFQGAHTEIANLKSSLRLIISSSPHCDIRRGEKKGGHQSKPAQSLCTVCGKFSHDSKACPAKGSPYANLTPSAFIGSAGHAKLVADRGPRSCLQHQLKYLNFI